MYICKVLYIRIYIYNIYIRCIHTHYVTISSPSLDKTSGPARSPGSGCGYAWATSGVCPPLEMSLRKWRSCKNVWQNGGVAKNADHFDKIHPISQRKNQAKVGWKRLRMFDMKPEMENRHPDDKAMYFRGHCFLQEAMWLELPKTWGDWQPS